MYEINETYTIWSHRLQDLQAAISTANNKVESIGNGGYSISVGEERMHEYTVEFESGQRKQRIGKVVDVTISGSYPHIAGWNLVAANNHFEGEERNIINMFPWSQDDARVNIPHRYRTTDADLCEECGVSRHRISTYIIMSDDGEYRQVGSTCLKSYTGNATVARMLSVISSIEYVFVMFKEASDLNSYGMNAPLMFRTEKVLAATNAVVNCSGWLSRKMAEDTFRPATADKVIDYLSFPPKDRIYKDIAHLDISDADYKVAADVTLWLEKMSERDDLNDYEFNLVAAGLREAVEPKYIGILASAVPAYIRSLEAERERQSRTNEHFGIVGKRYGSTKSCVGPAVNLEIVYSSGPYDSGFGPSWMNLLRDSDGRSFVWWTGRDLEYQYSRGTVLTVSFTVKAHEVYKETMQTIISRASWPELPAPQQPEEELF